MKSGNEPDWRRLFPDEDYGYHFGVSSGNPGDFFRSHDVTGTLLRERKGWLTENPQPYLVLEDAACPLLTETIRLAGEWETLSGKQLEPNANRPALQRLSCLWEPDIVLLKKGASGRFELVGGSVCFPSSWRLTDKVGRPLNEIHEPVPGLNESLGNAIDRFLDNLKPGTAWLRSNWGITPTADLNYHPDLGRPALGKPESPRGVFIRIEDQALVKLPESDGILFGIRLVIVPLPQLMQDAQARTGLARALRTMPDEVARYKNLSTGRSRICQWLESR